jgi:WD40 repeat protein
MPTGESPNAEQLTPRFSPEQAGPDDLTLVGGRVSFTTSTPLPSGDRFPRLPGYAIECELGRGGMGVVYRATQDRLNRTVAVKMLLHSDAADLSDVMRFRSEAEAVAAISHPNVVEVYESGQHEGRSYFAMEYLPGGSLHARLRRTAPFPPDTAAVLVEKLARAVHAAHCIGIVHRDIKPGNVLFDAAGEPRVTDFGLAKRSSQELTQTQAVMGTPAYMPPEQAAGRAKFVGPPADIYALGVILYECLTGATPFGGEDSLALLNQVIADEPPSIRTKVPAVPRDLELICFKCLEKGPADRYQTAAELADDLRRFTNREPVSVRPAWLIEKAVKWAKRRPTLAAAYGLAALVAALMIFGGGAAVLAVQAAAARDSANRHWQTAEQAREQLQQQADELETARATADGHWREAEKARDALQSKHEQVETALDGERRAKEALEKEHKELVDAREQMERSRYFADVALAHKEALAGNFLRAADLLDDCPENRRGWEWWHAYRVAHLDVGAGVSPGQLMYDVAFSGKGINLTTTHQGGEVTRFDFASGRGEPRRLGTADSFLRLSADGRRAVAVRAWDKPLDDGVSIWDVDGGKLVAAFPAPAIACHTCELSADGKRVAFHYEGHPVRAFEVDTGKELPAFNARLAVFERLRLSADGRVAVAIETTGQEAVVWAVDTGKEVRRVRCEHGKVAAVGLSPDGKTVATGSTTGEVRFHPAVGKSIGLRRAHVGQVSAISFSIDGKRAATAGDDGLVRVWDPATGEGGSPFHGHTKPVTALAFHPTEPRLASCDAAGGFRVWPLDNSTPASVRMGIGPRMKRAFAVDPELSRLFSADDASETGIEWPRLENVEHPVLAPKGDRFSAAALHPKGPQKVLGTTRGGVFLQADCGVNPVALEGFTAEVRMIRYSQDGSHFLATAGDQFRVWQSATGKVVHTGTVSDRANTVIALSGDGTRVAAGTGQRAVTISEVGTAKSYSVWLTEHVSMLAFTPDGKSLVVGTREWGLRTYPVNPADNGTLLGEGERRYVGHTSPVTSVGFSPDGTRIASGAADGSIRVWDVASGQEAIGLSTGTREPVVGVWFADQGRHLIAMPESGPPVSFDGSPRPFTLRPDRQEKPKKPAPPAK